MGVVFLLTMAMLLLLVTTALLAYQPVEGQGRLAAITKLKEAIVEAYPDKESLMLEVVDQFFMSAEANSDLSDCPMGQYCQTFEDCECVCRGNRTCLWRGAEVLERIRDLMAKDKAYLDENSLRLLEGVDAYLG